MFEDHPEYDGHEHVSYFHDSKSGLHAINALHRVRDGAGVGGIRFYPYASSAAALTDVLRLSRAMTYKFALARLTWGGGKTVVLGDPRQDKTEERLLALGRAVESLGGRYICAPDVGTGPQDMAIIRRETAHVAGLPGFDTSIPTALGLFHGLRAMAKAALGAEDLEGVRIAVQGAGGVGAKLCRHLTEAGARVLVADLDADRVQEVVAATGAQAIAADRVLEAEVDILSPCALGAVLDQDTIPKIRARGICGAANNQLRNAADGDLLVERGIHWAPDYVVSAGGIIGGSVELGKITEAECQARLEGIHDTTLEVLALAAQRQCSTDLAARELARRVLED